MKRNRMTLVALTVTGAMALTAAPAAFAQDSYTSSTPGGGVGSSWSTSEEGDYTTIQNVTFYRHAEGWVKSDTLRGVEWNAELQETSDIIASEISSDRAARAALSSGGGSGARTGENGGENTGGTGNGAGAFGSSGVGSGESTGGESDGAGSGAGGSSFNSEQNGTSTETESTGNGAGGLNLTSSDLSEQDWESIAGLALPAILIIGGIAWYLNQDGQNYVTDQSRVNESLSSNEVASSRAMLSSNFDSVVEQSSGSAGGENGTATEGEGTGASAGEGAGEGADETLDTASRGMAAETGNNTVPRALASLVLMSILGAAAFVLRRRFA